MKGYLNDVLYCLKISFYFFIVPFIIGIIIGFAIYGKDISGVIIWGCRFVQYFSILGLAIAGMSFLKQDLMRPLNYQNQWQTYFKKLNLAFVTLFISIFIAIFSYIIESFM